MRKGMRKFGLGLIGIGLLAACQSGTGNSTATDANATGYEDAADAINESNWSEAMDNMSEDASDTSDSQSQTDPMNDQEVPPRPR